MSNAYLVHDYAVNRTLIEFSKLGYLTEKVSKIHTRINGRVHVIATKKDKSISVHVYGLKNKTNVPLGETKPEKGDLIFIWTNVLDEGNELPEVFILSKSDFKKIENKIIRHNYHKTEQPENWLPVEIYEKYKDNFLIVK